MTKLISIVVILLTLSILSGCSKQSNETSTPSTAPSKTPSVTPSLTSSPISQGGDLPSGDANIFTEINAR